MSEALLLSGGLDSLCAWFILGKPPGGIGVTKGVFDKNGMRW